MCNLLSVEKVFESYEDHLGSIQRHQQNIYLDLNINM